MTLSLTCKHCGELIFAEDEDQLVENVQTHAATHGDKPPLSRHHILSRFHRLEARREHDRAGPP
jgi:hypothetical protein